MDWPFWSFVAFQFLPLVGFFLGACPCCGAATENCDCLDGAEGTFEVTFSGATNGDCSDCTFLNSATFSFADIPGNSCHEFAENLSGWFCSGLYTHVSLRLESSGSDITFKLFIAGTGSENPEYRSSAHSLPYDCKTVDEDISFWTSSLSFDCNWAGITPHIQHV